MTSTTSMQRERRSGELDLFGLYLNQVGRHPLVTKQDEIQLSQAYRQGLDAKLALAGLAAADPRRPGLAARAERGEQARRRIWRLSSTHVSPGVSPPAVTRQDSGGLAGFGT